MAIRNFLELPASQAQAAVCGGWTLKPGRALSLRPAAPGVLRIVRGRAWATVDGTRRTPGQALGDHFLHAGEGLLLGAGQHLVLEPHGEAPDASVDFEWSALAQPRTASRRQAAVIGPLHDLRLALLMAGRALGQLLAGLAGYGEYLIAGRGRVLPTLETNQP